MQSASGRIEQIGCPDPENIFYAEDTQGNNFCHVEKAGQKGQLREGLEKSNQDI